ncbi:hypothetical protein CLOACE_08650 [Clostridium acetireducens DSM 10703]|jgi:hypothetical protein|uniref:Bacteriophage peptidoglycan hydrolase n=1 Tax=Clostridium acetireducens DSM 10703 TaxID=1121290 RepID=A0A1E8EZW9_9CLOT|nr:hypothetical protein [Clostridium acetireducens]OFI06710.1 hypothetical protein CLOACE_08650 [Clostridium acetireducens DSM 10703]
MRRMKLYIKIILIGLLFILILKEVIPRINIMRMGYSSKRVYEFLTSERNRRKTYLDAANLNGGTSQNACVFFVSEVLRNNNYEVPKSMGNTGEFISFLKEKGWKKRKNYKRLKPGNVCFTTDESGNNKDIPTHTYIFMGWVEEGKYDYAYICDNQAKDYKNKIYHIRNINCIDRIKGNTKEAFSFFMTID